MATYICTQCMDEISVEGNDRPPLMHLKDKSVNATNVFSPGVCGVYVRAMNERDGL